MIGSLNAPMTIGKDAADYCPRCLVDGTDGTYCEPCQTETDAWHSAHLSHRIERTGNANNLRCLDCNSTLIQFRLGR